ncbi:cobalamin-5'-phosphate synthase [Haloactinopolyspora alba]|uniref:Adenosylcobinamide-GDP ribazoletransferase n=1 Tax=Haloactinopolyspora alba TaxID=648780 RepID=A0A2P8E6Q8_9ACTN|nr:adenosylcobinamide-GDP ribazoletransferase [Haloactinopolyspora alba]PSL05155.1 cobalamin-5'-phosphate synthase [Haloactinopolyspora alba]
MRLVAGFRAALGFLTRVPVGRIDAADMSLTRAGGYFPLVGAVVAAVATGVWWLGTSTAGPAAGAVLSVLAAVVVTGAIHEDGLADTADGLWGGADRDRRLQIMRDSRVGTYGVVAIAGDLAIRTAVLMPFGSGDLADATRILVAGHVLGRAAPLVLAAVLPPARTDGQGSRLGRPGAGGTALATVTVALAAVACAGWWAPVLVGAAAVPVLGLAVAARRRVGGATGDILGAGVALTNLTVAAVAAALIREGLV